MNYLNKSYKKITPPPINNVVDFKYTFLVFKGGV